MSLQLDTCCWCARQGQARGAAIKLSDANAFRADPSWPGFPLLSPSAARQLYLIFRRSSWRPRQHVEFRAEALQRASPSTPRSAAPSCAWPGWACVCGLHRARATRPSSSDAQAAHAPQHGRAPAGAMTNATAAGQRARGHAGRAVAGDAAKQGRPCYASGERRCARISRAAPRCG